MEWLSAAQMWVIVAAFALIAELFTVSFFFFFLSVGAAITALLTWLGITPDSTSQLLCFVVVSLVSLALFRKYALRIFGKNERVDSYQSFVGDRAVVSLSIPANGEGKIHYRGTEWIALSHKGIPLAEGTSVVVKKMDGIRVIVEAADI